MMKKYTLKYLYIPYEEKCIKVLLYSSNYFMYNTKRKTWQINNMKNKIKKRNKTRYNLLPTNSVMNTIENLSQINIKFSQLHKKQ